MCVFQEKQLYITQELQRKGESETSGMFNFIVRAINFTCNVRS